MSGKSAQRFYQVKSGESELAILAGKNPLDFERLHTGLAEEFMPDGLLEEDALLTIAKCMWRKMREYQGRIVPDVKKTAFDYKKAQQDLLALHKALVEGAAEHKIRHHIRCQQLPWEYVLLRHFPREDFESTEAWTKAMAEHIKQSMLPLIAKEAEAPGPTSDGAVRARAQI